MVEASKRIALPISILVLVCQDPVLDSKLNKTLPFSLTKTMRISTSWHTTSNNNNNNNNKDNVTNNQKQKIDDMTTMWATDTIVIFLQNAD